MLRYLAEVIGDLAFDDGQNLFVSSLMFHYDCMTQHDLHDHTYNMYLYHKKWTGCILEQTASCVVTRLLGQDTLATRWADDR
jgi:hypothetical protein